MNREIKFRIWNCDINTFQEYVYITNPLQKANDYNNNKYIFQQYTGLKDTIGQDIYEGDILDIQTEDRPDDLQWELASVEFKKGCFWINGVFEEPINELIVGDRVDGKIVGNILENPEFVRL